MEKIPGTACLVYVGDTATPVVYTKLEGQQSATFDGSTTTADTTDKNNEGWQTSMSVTLSGKVTVSGQITASRPQLDKAEAAWLDRATLPAKIVFDKTGRGYSGDFYVTQFQITGDTKDAAKYSLTLEPAAALTKITGA